MPNLVSCRDCRYWVRETNNKEDMGECRRYAPQYAYVDKATYKKRTWLATYGYDQCGDGAPRNADPKAN